MIKNSYPSDAVMAQPKTAITALRLKRHKFTEPLPSPLEMFHFRTVTFNCYLISLSTGGCSGGGREGGALRLSLKEELNKILWMHPSYPCRNVHTMNKDE